MFADPVFSVMATILVVVGIFILATANGGSCGYTIGSFSVIVGIISFLRIFKKRKI